MLNAQTFEYGHLFEIKPMLDLLRKEEHELRICALVDNSGLLSVCVVRKGEEVAIRKDSFPDRRIARTQKLLRDALHSLIREKDYDSIVVKEILDRANVGRSAFYTHFRDKDELLASGIHDILGSVPPTHSKTVGSGNEKALWFSLPIFEHLDRQRRSGELKLGPRGRAILHGHLQKVLAKLIGEDVRRSLPGRRKTSDTVPSDLLIQYVASTFILVLNWWVESKSSLPAKQVNGLFRTLILPVLNAHLD